MEEEFEFITLDNYQSFTPEEEEQELDEFGNPIIDQDPAKGFFGQLFGEDVKRNETYEEREARQSAEIEACLLYTSPSQRE